MSASASASTLHNTLLGAGWSLVPNQCNRHRNHNRFVYRLHNPYDEFILDYSSSGKIVITVPIKCRNSSVAYQNTFSIENIATVANYIQIHLANNL